MFVARLFGQAYRPSDIARCLNILFFTERQKPKLSLRRFFDRRVTLDEIANSLGLLFLSSSNGVFLQMRFR